MSITFACCIAGGSFMPEGVKEVPRSLAEQIVTQCRYILDSGFDNTECGASMLVCLSDGDYRTVLRENEKQSLCIKACNSLVPPTMKITGENVDFAALERYAENVTERMNALGASIAVFGSGGARSLPDGFDIARGQKQLADFMTMFAEKGERRGVRLAIEPLRSRESNIFNTVTECADASRATHCDGVCLLADSFHMAEEKTPVSDLDKVIDRLIHCHISEPISRAYPGSTDSGDRTYNPLFAAELLKLGYRGTVSVECGFMDFAKDVPAAYAYLKQIFQVK